MPKQLGGRRAGRDTGKGQVILLGKGQMMQRAALTDKAYQHIREAVVSGALRSGAFISEAGIARELGVSRTPVGEAIRQLADEGLVEQLPRVGTIVRGITSRDLVQMHEIRTALEPFAAGKAAKCVTQETLAQLERYCRAMREGCESAARSGSDVVKGPALRRCLAADLAFHLLIVEAVDNWRMIRIFKEIGMPSRLLRVERSHSLNTMWQSVEGHEKILNALRRGDSAGAREAMNEHLGQVHAAILDVVDASSSAPTGSILRELPDDVLSELDAIDNGNGWNTDIPGMDGR